ncbi:MAG: ATP-dependent Clp protease adaptor ClpS [Myxococcota bacterium]
MSAPSTSAGIPRPPQRESWWQRLIRWLLAPLFMKPPAPDPVEEAAQRHAQQASARSTAELDGPAQDAWRSASGSAHEAGRGVCLHDLAAELLERIPGLDLALMTTGRRVADLQGELRRAGKPYWPATGLSSNGMRALLARLPRGQPVGCQTMLRALADGEAWGGPGETAAVEQALDEVMGDWVPLLIAEQWPQGTPRCTDGPKDAPHRLVLHNDDATTQEFVVSTLREDLGQDEAEATRIMWEVHHSGRCHVGGLSAAQAHEMCERITQRARANGFPLVVHHEAEPAQS